MYIRIVTDNYTAHETIYTSYHMFLIGIDEFLAALKQEIMKKDVQNVSLEIKKNKKWLTLQFDFNNKHYPKTHNPVVALSRPDYTVRKMYHEIDWQHAAA